MFGPRPTPCIERRRIAHARVAALITLGRDEIGWVWPLNRDAFGEASHAPPLIAGWSGLSSEGVALAPRLPH
jgi:hypothetical protein